MSVRKGINSRALWFAIGVTFVVLVVTIVDASTIKKTQDSGSGFACLSDPSPDDEMNESLEKKDINNDEVDDLAPIERKKRAAGMVNYPRMYMETALGKFCKTQCSKQGTDYYWCRTHNKYWFNGKEYDWDICSPFRLDFKGKFCIDRCSHRNPPYTQCDIGDGNLSICSMYRYINEK